MLLIYPSLSSKRITNLLHTKVKIYGEDRSLYEPGQHMCSCCHSLLAVSLSPLACSNVLLYTATVVASCGSDQYRLHASICSMLEWASLCSEAVRVSLYWVSRRIPLVLSSNGHFKIHLLIIM